MITKYCVVCGAAFEAKAPHAKYCSTKCKESVRWKTSVSERAARNAEIIRKHKEGETAESISESCGISVSQINKILKSGGEKTDAQKQRERKYKELREYVLQGHSRKEAAKAFGVSVSVVLKAANGIGTVYKNQYANGEGLDKFKEHLGDDFEYVGNYTGSDGFADIRCKRCGAVFTRSCISVRHNGTRCDNCIEIRAQERKAAKEAEKEKRQAERTRVRMISKAKAEQKKIYQTSLAICKECGGVFVLESRRDRLYCSSECSKRINNRRNKDKRIRRISKGKRDWSITLERLAKRDNDVCYLCGGAVDWNDKERRDDGTIIAGDYYPSIDHVKPISKGGAHRWDNVRLAHRICNTKKSDKSPLKF